MGNTQKNKYTIYINTVSGNLHMLGPVLEKARFQNWHCPFRVLPVLERTDFLIPVLELAPFLESPYVL
jgi:hypothetical protein